MHEARPGWKQHFAQVLKIGRTSLYVPALSQADRDETDLSGLLGAHADHPGYGYRRLAIALQWGVNKTRRLMCVGNIVPLGVKRSKYAGLGGGDGTASESQTTSETRQNLLKERNLVALHFGQLWAEDFTYILFQGKMYYLATIIDLYNREVVGWALSDHHDTDLIVAALLDALSRQEPPGILHQDQGSEYCSRRYDVILLSVGIEASFSDKGHPWENGFQESFYRYFKIEIKVKELDRFADLGALHEAIAKQLRYYNHERIHSALGMSPREFVDTAKERPQSPARTTTTPTQLVATQHKRRHYFQQMVTGVRDWVFGKVGA